MKEKDNVSQSLFGMRLPLLLDAMEEIWMRSRPVQWLAVAIQLTGQCVTLAK